MSRSHKIMWAILGLIGVAVLSFFALWLVVITSTDPLHTPLGALPLPVACTTHSCVFSSRWRAQTEALDLFARTSHEPAPSATQTLTTLVRQHLVSQSLVRSPVTADDVTRYRSDVLHLTDEQLVREKTGLSLADYDHLVVKPFLEEQALLQIRHDTSLDQLFHQLGQEHVVWIFARGLTWDAEMATVVQK